jgi:hypothetical protein
MPPPTAHPIAEKIGQMTTNWSRELRIHDALARYFSPVSVYLTPRIRGVRQKCRKT